MVSKQAREAYPDAVRGDDERYDDWERREYERLAEQEAFDRGAVTALREAAKAYESMWREEGDVNARATAEWFTDWADEWGREASGE